jgi:hypothetical protein
VIVDVEDMAFPRLLLSSDARGFRVRGIAVRRKLDFQLSIGDRRQFVRDDQRNELAPHGNSAFSARGFRAFKRPNQIRLSDEMLDGIGCVHTAESTAC